MSTLSAPARLWTATVLAAGGVLVALMAFRLVQRPAWETVSNPTFAAFLLLASLTHAFPVVAPRHQVYHATQAFLLAALLLLPWESVALVVCVVHGIEWLRRRRAWYVQFYNAASYLLSATAAAGAYAGLNGSQPFLLGDPGQFAAGVVAIAAFLFVNHGLLAIMLRLARGVTLRASGLFGLESLGIDAMLLAMGVPIAVCWNADPRSILLTSAPIVLVYRALQLPGLEQAAHRDRLTGLYNRRHLTEALTTELIRAGQFGRPTSVLVATLDSAADLASEHGRASMDFLTAGVAERLRSSARGYDLVARIGESSFALVLPETDANDAQALAANLLAAIANRPHTLVTTSEPVRASLSGALVTVTMAVDPARLVQRLELVAERAGLIDANTLVRLGAADLSPLEQRSPPYSGVTLAHPAEGARGQSTQGAVSAGRATGYPAWALTALQWGVALPALALSGQVLASDGTMGWEAAALVAGLVLVTEMLAFELHDRSSFSINLAPIIAAILLFGPEGTLVGTWTAALTRGILRRSRWNRVLFNGSVFTLGGLLAALVYHLVGERITVGQLGPLVLATLGASTAYYLHTIPVAVAVALDGGMSVWQVWERSYRWLYPHYVILGLMGLGLAVATVEVGPLGTAVFLAPPLMMRFVVQQYVHRTSAVVQRLEAANEGLTTSSHMLRRRGEELALLSDLGHALASEPLTANLPTVVAPLCVPSLGEVCAVVWTDPAPGGIR